MLVLSFSFHCIESENREITSRPPEFVLTLANDTLTFFSPSRFIFLFRVFSSPELGVWREFINLINDQSMSVKFFDIVVSNHWITR